MKNKRLTFSLGLFWYLPNIKCIDYFITSNYLIYLKKKNISLLILI